MNRIILRWFLLGVAINALLMHNLTIEIRRKLCKPHVLLTEKFNFVGFEYKQKFCIRNHRSFEFILLMGKNQYIPWIHESSCVIISNNIELEQKIKLRKIVVWRKYNFWIGFHMMKSRISYFILFIISIFSMEFSLLVGT